MGDKNDKNKGKSKQEAAKPNGNTAHDQHAKSDAPKAKGESAGNGMKNDARRADKAQSN